MTSLDDVQRGYDRWAAKPHNAKWVRKIDGTPIANDLVVNIFEALKETPPQSSLGGQFLPTEDGEFNGNEETGPNEPVLYVSEKQLEQCIGTYLPTRKEAEGNFQLPLYRNPPPQTSLMGELKRIADEIQALKLHPTTPQEYDAGYIAARNDAFVIVQETVDNFPLGMPEATARRVLKLLDVYAPDVFNLEMAATVASAALSHLEGDADGE